MGGKRKAPNLDAVAADLAKLMEVKRRLIESGIASEDMDSVHEIFEDIRLFLRCLLEDLEAALRNGRLEDMTPEQAQQAIYGIRIFEDSLRSDYPELRH